MITSSTQNYVKLENSEAGLPWTHVVKYIYYKNIPPICNFQIFYEKALPKLFYSIRNHMCKCAIVYPWALESRGQELSIDI